MRVARTPEIARKLAAVAKASAPKVKPLGVRGVDGGSIVDAETRMFLMNGRNETVHALDHESGEILTTFLRPGHQIGNFTHGTP